MSGIEWLVFVLGPLLFICVVSNYLFGRYRDRSQQQLNSIDQLDSRLNKKIVGQSTQSEQALSTATSKKILQNLRDSESQEDLPNRLGYSSIGPVEESVVLISEHLDNLDAKLVDKQNIATLSLAALAVIYVRSHIKEMIRVEEMAQELRVSRVKLNSFLNQTLGCSAQVLIKVIKMQEAKKLLKQGELRVKEVAFRVGYPNPYHFSVRFKLFFGMAPRVFQKHYQKQDNRIKIKGPASVSDSSVNQIGSRVDTVAGKDDQDRHRRMKEEDLGGLDGLAQGTRVDRFLIVDMIGRGGMGVVYKAYDPKLNRGVALKLIRADHAQSIQSQSRLLREAQALARLSHPNVLPVYDVGTFEQQIFMAMALVEGQTLNDWLKSQQRTVDEIVRVLIAAGQGLSAAHRAGLVHRDFKPGNIIVGNDGQVKVLDFGLARAVSAPTSDEDNSCQAQATNPVHEIKETDSDSVSNLLATPLTHAGHILGTPLYMAPEHFLFQELDEKTDQFSFCVTLFEALYGRRPFPGRTSKEFKENVTSGRIEIPRDADVPKWIEEIIRKGISISKDDRYPSMLELLDALQDDPTIARAKRNRKLLIASLMFLLTAMTLGLGYYAFSKSSKMCTGADLKLAGIWNDERKEKIRQSFSNTRLSYANESFVRVEKLFGDYLSKWSTFYTETCKATRIRGEQSEEVMDLKMGCLNKHLMNAGALIKVFGAADKTVVEKAVQAVASLSGFYNCSDVEALRSRIPPPKDEITKDKVAEIREKLAKVEALQKTGKYREGLELVKSLKKETKTIDYKPIKAETHYWLGDLLELDGQYKMAETVLYESAQLAAKSRDCLLAAKSMWQLTWVVGYQQARHEEGLSIGRYAKLMLDAAGGDEKIRGKLLNTLGVVFYSKGKYDKALEYYQRSLAIREKTLGPQHPDVAASLSSMGVVFQDQAKNKKALEYYSRSLAIRENTLGHEHPEVARSLNNMGVVFWKQNEYDKALEYYQKSLAIVEKALGPQHPNVAQEHNNIGLVLWKKGEFEKSLDHFQRALLIWERSLGKNHPQLAWPLSGLGAVYQATKRNKEALEKFSLVMELCKKVACYPEPEGMAYFGLAKIYWSQAKDRERAINFAQKASEVYSKWPKFRREFEQVETFLKNNALSNRISASATKR